MRLSTCGQSSNRPISYKLWVGWAPKNFGLMWWRFTLWRSLEFGTCDMCTWPIKGQCHRREKKKSTMIFNILHLKKKNYTIIFEIFINDGIPSTFQKIVNIHPPWPIYFGCSLVIIPILWLCNWCTC